MSSTRTNPTMILDTGRSSAVLAVAFHPDGKHVLGGGNGTIRQWRLEDGQAVGEQTGMVFYAISVSKDHEWIVLGTREGASVWDKKMNEKVIDIQDVTLVYAVDVSPDSTRFAAGTLHNQAIVWSIKGGEKLVGPLRHDNDVNGIKFSPNGKHIATVCDGGSIRVFDSHNGDELITIKTISPSTRSTSTPLAWSNDGQQIFAASKDKKIKSFNVTTGSQLAESQTLSDDDVHSIALAGNGKFIATYALRSIAFLDSSTLSRIGSVMEDSEDINSIALSLDGSYLATGREDGKITVRSNLGSILPDAYGPFHVSTEQPSTSGAPDNNPSDSAPKEKSSSVKSETHSNDGDGDLLEVEAPSNVPAPQFDYEDSLSPVSSINSPEDEIPPVGPSHAVPQSSDTPPVTSPTEAHSEAHHNKAVESSQGLRSFKRWLHTNIRRSKKDPGLHEADRRSGKSRRPAAADRRSPSQSAERVDVINEGISHMAATRRVPRAVAKPVVKRQPKSVARVAGPKHRNKHASHSGKRPAGATEAGAAQQVNDSSPPTTGTVRVSRESDKAILSIALPGWMCFGSSSTRDGTH